MKFCTAALLSALLSLVHADETNPIIIGSNTTAPTTVVDVIGDTAELATLLQAAKLLPGVVDMLTNPVATLTVFAPINSALEGLDAKFLTPNWQVHLMAVLAYHVIQDAAVLSSAITDGMKITTSLASDAITAKVDNGVFFSGKSFTDSQVTIPDLVADNGVVHGVDQLFMPTALTINLLDLAKSTDGFDQVGQLLTLSGLESEISADDRTVYAPSDTAFGNLPAYLTDAVGNDIDLIGEILKNHIAEGVFPGAFHVDGYQVTMLSGTVFTVSVKAPGSRFQEISLDEGVPITVADQIGSNGLIHVIEGVLLKEVNVNRTDAPTISPMPTEAPVVAPPSASTYIQVGVASLVAAVAALLV